ncbi:MAG: 1-(5-phosphoribosyl)-5-[Selenomonadaceae bacterium]|nr:1-(5-phosphoribosyl)-5-[(5-phosphoribosylamino)methylideneamino]imidazole-4-carboxamide isomerase [Selenomonadaceae bacterium]
MIILPAIDILGGKCVRLTQGDYDKKFTYSMYPEDTAVELQDAGAHFLHVVDLDGAKIGHPMNIFTIRKILENVTIPIEVGGGIRSMEEIDLMLDLGVERVMIGTAAVENPKFVREAAAQFGEKIAVSIDARDGVVAVNGWGDSGEIAAEELAARIGDCGITTITYTDIARDGMLTGVNVEMVAKIAEKSGLSVIASGGVNSLDNIRQLKEKEHLGVIGAIIGKAIYEGVVDLQEALKVASE